MSREIKLDIVKRILKNANITTFGGMDLLTRSIKKFSKKCKLNDSQELRTAVKFIGNTAYEYCLLATKNYDIFVCRVGNNYKKWKII